MLLWAHYKNRSEKIEDDDRDDGNDDDDDDHNMMIIITTSVYLCLIPSDAVIILKLSCSVLIKLYYW